MRQLVADAAERQWIRRVDVVKTVDALWGLYLGIAQIEWNKLRWTKKDHLRDTLHYAFALMFTGICLEHSPIEDTV